MREASVWARLLGVEGAVVVRVELEAKGDVIAHVRPYFCDVNKCGWCRRSCPRYDAGSGRRRWRALDLGTVAAHVEADAPRVTCPTHGVVAEFVPWARPGVRFTRFFEETVAWLAARTDKTAVAGLMRVAWRTVGSIIERVVEDVLKTRPPLAGLRRIGVDEVSFRKGQRYLTVVVDHDTGHLVWAREGCDKATLCSFFDELGKEACDRIELVSADASPAFTAVIREKCPSATLCTDPFHVVQWATEAIERMRRQVWRESQRQGLAVAPELKGARYALLKNPENLSDGQEAKLALVAKVNKPLYRAYLLKEQLRQVFKLRGDAGVHLLKLWLSWAARARLPEFDKVRAAVLTNLRGIQAALRHGLSNARVESLNNRLRLLTRVAYGFHSAGALIALAMLKLGGTCPALPGRTHANVN